MGATSGTGSPAGAGAGTPDGAVSGEPGAGYSLGVSGPAGWGSPGLGSALLTMVPSAVCEPVMDAASPAGAEPVWPAPEASDVETSSPVVSEAPAALAVTGPDRSSCGSEETG